MTRLRLLVVDVDAKFPHFVTELLIGAGYDVRGTSDPFAAVPLAEDFHPDLMIFDLSMPGRDGLELAEELRREGKRPKSHVFASRLGTGAGSLTLWPPVIAHVKVRGGPPREHPKSVPFAGPGGDPQVATDHPWYPGELSASTFERLFKTQAALYRRVTGRGVESDEDKALASWYWRNLNYAHSIDGSQDCWARG